MQLYLVPPPRLALSLRRRKPHVDALLSSAQFSSIGNGPNAFRDPSSDPRHNSVRIVQPYVHPTAEHQKQAMQRYQIALEAAEAERAGRRIDKVGRAGNPETGKELVVIRGGRCRSPRSGKPGAFRLACSGQRLVSIVVGLRFSGGGNVMCAGRLQYLLCFRGPV